MADNTLHDTLPEILYSIGDLADTEGIQCYLVGGYVRDLLMQRPSQDIDIMVIGDPIPFTHSIERKLGGRNFVLFERFRTARLEIDDPHEGPILLELVGARKESYNHDSRKPITEVGTLQDDLSRRDFTINALAVSLNSETRGSIIDLFHGMEDMQLHRLRTPLEPEKTFSDDPLRMMRAARFSSQLQFRLDPVTLEAMKAMHQRIGIVSRERVSNEFLKIMQSPKPSVGLHILYETGLLKEILPEITAMSGIEQVDGLGHKDTMLHTFQVVDKLAEKSDKLWLRIAALLHDIAKPATKRFAKSAGWTFHGHEVVGTRIAAKIFRNMRWPQDPRAYVQKMIRLHHRPIPLSGGDITDSAVRRLMFEAGEDLHDLMTLCRADVTSKNPRKVRRIMENFNRVEEKIAEVGEKDMLAKWRPPVNGKEIMDELGLNEGRIIGIIKKKMEAAIIDGIIPYDHDAAMEFVRTTWKEMQQEDNNSPAT
ncbi:CCA tRNA nucleotidyltransferase [Prosthecochloris sp. CIB 2401]|uniref:CCA tRNA nucleotidyltransferase n=1 Tax=Prosthecochloris sp. CIB 2401 TaxID=1868325 RepID=UPI00080AA179|nr:CCA tRNA nucleotidyltransferase [Prosthecochloris sp. CIB 2401]ANT65052.1 Multifunctional CCA protein [Prosthecochloris sp. CIB 2401]